jgi:methionine-rich copper-binding protein CopC
MKPDREHRCLPAPCSPRRSCAARLLRSALAAAVTVACGAVLGLAAAPRAASAHATLVKSAPARRATLTQAPPRVELTFNERLEPAYASVSVTDASGRQVDLKDAAVAREDGKRLTVSLPPLAPGSYTVQFRVLSVDGHVVESSFPFTVRTTAPR